MISEEERGKKKRKKAFFYKAVGHINQTMKSVSPDQILFIIKNNLLLHVMMIYPPLSVANQDILTL
jgi:hypothetical protein